MQAIAEEYCPTCGSQLGTGDACVLCGPGRTAGDADIVDRAYRPCRRCAMPVLRNARVCDICGADHPTSPGGLAPVAQFVLGLGVLAAVLALYGVVFGLLVP